MALDQKAPLLSVKNLNIHISSAGVTTHVVKDINFEILEQSTFALVGESGSGKSLTALALAKLIPPHIFPEISGTLSFEGEDISQIQGKALHELRGGRIAYIFQDPMTSLNPLKTVFEQIYENLVLHTDIHNRSKGMLSCHHLLKQVQLPATNAFSKRYPHELSGGQRQRVMIAMALAGQAKLLVADEPTTALDVTVQAEILQLLADLQKTHALSYLFITHDLGLVRRFADHIAIMRYGEICELGVTQEILNHPKDAYTKELFDAELTILKRSPLTKDTKVTSAPKLSSRPSMSEIKNEALALHVKDLSVTYPILSPFLRRRVNYFEAVKALSFQLAPGRTLGVIGESGSGKTSLALAILRLIHSHGEIHLAGRAIHNKNNMELRRARRKMQVVFQDPFSSLSPRLTIQDIISEGLRLHQPKLTPKEIQERVFTSMEQVDLNPKTAARYPHEFSGGERQRIAIARATILNPALLILDEPTSSLDVSLQIKIIEQLLRIQNEKQMAYLFISHDLRVIRALSDEIIVMQDGEVRAQGTSYEIFNKSEDAYTKKLVKAAFLK